MKHRISAVNPKQNWMIPSTFISLLSCFLRRIFIIVALVSCLPLNLIRGQYLIPDSTYFSSTPYNKKGSFEANGFKKIFTFSPSTSGIMPTDLIVYNNILYGNAFSGGLNNAGLIYRLKTDGTAFEKLDIGTNCRWPWWLALSHSVIYGTTAGGGTYNKGVLYKINTDGTGFQILYNFNFTFTYPRYFIILSGDIIYGSATDFATGKSSVTFKIKTDGTGYTALKVHDGSRSNVMLLLYNDYLYGTTYDQGTTEPSKIFKIKADGTGYLKLHDFNSQENGQYPYGILIVVGSTLYGTTRKGGANDCGIFFKINTDGTGFEKLHSFSKENGYNVTSGLVRKGATFYGASRQGGINDLGTIFRINANGSGFSKLFDFTDTINGYGAAHLVLSGDTIFGITNNGGGTENGGTIFRYFIDKSHDSINKQLKAINIPYTSPEKIIIDTKENLAVEIGNSINLDTTFTITGSVSYTHSWKVKADYGYEIIDKTAKITSGSTFYLFLTTIQGCSYLDSIFVKATTPNDIQEIDIKNQINIYPNPNAGDFRIKIPDGYAKYSYDIFDVLGVNIANGSIDCPTEECIFTIKLTNATPGVYNIIIKKDNKFYNHRKFIISK